MGTTGEIQVYATSVEITVRLANHTCRILAHLARFSQPRLRRLDHAIATHQTTLTLDSGQTGVSCSHALIDVQCVPPQTCAHPAALSSSFQEPIAFARP